jgi:isoquinoline 1-oxidoreductase subunit alpha
MTVNVNDRNYTIDADPAMPILWMLRDILHLTGTKYGCGKGLCGACMIHIDGKAVNACLTKLSAAEGKKITTIEGISDVAKEVQQAWVNENVPQCGYCQPGQIMSAVALLNNNEDPNDADIAKAMSRNICRCGTYQRIRKAIHEAVKLKQAK